jgi:GNAT superfamily N-acetyltransferase
MLQHPRDPASSSKQPFDMKTLQSASCRMRQLDPRHYTQFQTLLIQLDQHSRCSRFGFPPSDAALTAHAGSAFQHSSSIIGAFVDNRLRGALEVYRGAVEQPAKVEIVVEQRWRRRGLATALLKCAAQWAASNDVYGLRLVFSRYNWPMRQLARKANARLDVLLGEICADIEIDLRKSQRLTSEQLQYG